MDRAKIILSISLAVCLILIGILLKNGCKDPPKPCPEIVSSDTTSKTDVKETWPDTNKIHWIDSIRWNDSTRFHSVPYFDTAYSPEILELIRRGRQAIAEGNHNKEDFDMLMEYPATYDGEISDSMVKINYSVDVRGFMDNINIGYRIMKPFSVTRTQHQTITNTIKPHKRLKSLYFGSDIESDLDSLIYFEPELSLVTQKWIFSGGVSLPSKPKRWKIGIKRKIF